MAGKHYQLKIIMTQIQPTIWRRVVVSDHTSLYELHHIIQLSFGWLNYHLYLFRQNNICWGNTKLWDNGDSSFIVNSDKSMKIRYVLHDHIRTLQYEYDMGDSWHHSIELEAILDSGSHVNTPVCLDGERNCPPEDCGGFPGYYDLLEALKKPKSREYKEIIAWLGYPFEPEKIDIKRINEALKNLKKYIREYEE